MPYVLPQVQVFQEFRVLPTTVVQNLNAFVFGPHYQLFRYSEASEKILIGLVGGYKKDLDKDYSYPNQPADSTVDLSYVKLYMENLLAQYAVITSGAANPLNIVSVSERNKLRAAPVIAAPVSWPGSAKPHLGTGAARGYFRGNVTTPIDYYMWPVGGTRSGSWDPTGYKATMGTEDVMLAYRSSEGVSGIVPVLSADNPFGAGVYIPGPDGLQHDWDVGGTNNIMRRPVQITIASGTSSFVLTPKAAAMPAIIDWALAPAPLYINFKMNLGSALNQVSWVTSTKQIFIEANGTYPIGQLCTDLKANSDIATYFDITTSTATDVVLSAEDEAAVDYADNSVHNLNYDVYRQRVTPNPYLFVSSTGNPNSGQFKTRGVKVGDRVRYEVTDDLTVLHEGMTRVVDFEADQHLAIVHDPTLKATNGASQAPTDVDSGLAIVVPGSDNQRTMDGAGTALFDLAGGSTPYFTGKLSAGVISDIFRVTITTTGLAGVAKATVTNDSGTYNRTNVPITDAYGSDGQIYLGDNLYINFTVGMYDLDAEFQAGDVYYFNQNVDAPYTQVDTNAFVVEGSYTGVADTTYLVEVVRGGVFDRTVSAFAGLHVPVAYTALTPGVAWTTWAGGDVDDEYILKCVAAGDIATAVFEMTSLLGDNQTGIQFGATVTDVDLGSKGLYAQFSNDVAFSVGDYWVIKLNACRPQVRISDTAGVDASSYVVVNDGTTFDVGHYGVQMTFNSNANTEGGFCSTGGLLLGDVFYIGTEAVGDAAIRTLVLADDLPEAVTPGIGVGDVTNSAPNNFGVWLYLVQATTEISGKKLQSPPDYNWKAGAAVTTVYSDIAVQDVSWFEPDGSMPYLPVYSADMYLQYRALLAEYTDTIHSISDISLVTVELGSITPDNPLAQGVYNALSNSGDRAVYYMATPTADLAGFMTVLDRASLSGAVYAFAPLTQDPLILDAVQTHILDLSTEENKRWRIGFVGKALPTTKAVYHKLNNPIGAEYYAVIVDDPSISGDQYTIVKFTTAGGAPSPYTHCYDDVKAGDKVRINYGTDLWGVSTYDEYTVAARPSSNTQLQLVSGPATGIGPTKVEVWHNNTTAEIADAVAAESAAFASRRMYNVFPAVLGAFGVIETSEFGAAAVAGLCSSVAPQQGLTNIELNGFDDLPMVYSMFNRTQLNKMAEYGTLIIMQDIAGGPIYIRHQVSTAALDGDLNTTELSVTKNLDSISYFFSARLAPLIGRYNITPELLAVIKTQIGDGLMYLGSYTNVGMIGPQVILQGTSIERVEQHPVLLDHVVAVVNLQLPYPLNVLQLHLVV